MPTISNTIHTAFPSAEITMSEHSIYEFYVEIKERWMLILELIQMHSVSPNGIPYSQEFFGKFLM